MATTLQTNTAPPTNILKGVKDPTALHICVKRQPTSIHTLHIIIKYMPEKILKQKWSYIYNVYELFMGIYGRYIHMFDIYD